MNRTTQTVTFGGDPEVKTYGDGKKMVSFSGAVARRFHKEGETDTDWFKYVAFGATAEFIAKYFKKGSKALIEGSFQNNNYTKDDGTKVYGFQMVIDNVEFFGKKSDGNVPGGGDAAPASDEPAASNPAPAEQPAAKPNPAPATESYDAYDDF